MDRINGLCDELLIKILSFVPTKVAVSTSILSKRWEFLWMWVPELEYDYDNDITAANRSESSRLRYRAFINKNLPLHRAPVIESLRLRLWLKLVQPDDIEVWVGIAVSRCARELSISHWSCSDEPLVVMPSSLYTCKSLVTLKLQGSHILVDVPSTVCLPSLKTLQLVKVTYLNEDSVRLLPSCFPVVEDLVIERCDHDNVKAVVVTVPSLQRLSLWIDGLCSSDGYVIDTPCLIKPMPKLEEACLVVEKDMDEFLEFITPVKRLSLKVLFNNEDESMYSDGIVFDQLEHLNLTICEEHWSKLLVRLLSDSPKLRVLNLDVHRYDDDNYERINWSNELSSTPKCLLKSLETFEFEGYEGRPEERDFLSFLFLKARRLKSTSVFRSSSESESE